MGQVYASYLLLSLVPQPTSHGTQVRRLVFSILGQHKVSILFYKFEVEYLSCVNVSFLFKLAKIYKGGGFYDRLGADVGTKNPKKSALGTFLDRSG